MGGGMGGRGGMMGGMGGGTMPASMGMMMLGRLIMTLVGDRDSWDQRSLMSGMMGGMGGGMMGGMGGMGGGMMGGMGGGFRSVPPTSLPYTTLKPHQTRHLMTQAVAIDRTQGGRDLKVPPKGARLRIGDVAQGNDDPRVQKALRRLAEDKAPQTVSQLVMWKVGEGLTWDEIADRSRGWANEHERALAQQFVARLDDPREPLSPSNPEQASAPDSGRLYWELTDRGENSHVLSGALRTLLKKSSILGLRAVEGMPGHPDGPALACQTEIEDTRISVRILTTDGRGSSWVPCTSFELNRPITNSTSREDLNRQAAETADALAAEILKRLVHVEVSRPRRVHDKLIYPVKISNDSPLILNGLALSGAEDSPREAPGAVNGLCLPPHKSMTIPASADVVKRLNPKAGGHAVAADLSGL